MELKEYLNILIKRGWIILLVAVITASSAFVFSKLQTVTYRSTIWLNVWPGRPDWGLQQTIKGLLRNYSGQIKSRDAAQEVINQQQLDMTVENLLGEMTVSPIESDFLLQIDVDDIDPQRAQAIAQTAAEVFVEKTRVRMLDQDKADRVDVNLRDDATPATVFWPKTKLLTFAGGLFGLLAGALVVLGLEWLGKDTIREGRDVERHTGLTVLGSIPWVAAKSK